VEYHWHGLWLLTGNAYVLAGLALFAGLGAASALLWRREARARSGSVAPAAPDGSGSVAPASPDGSGSVAPVAPDGSGSTAPMTPDGSGSVAPASPDGSGSTAPTRALYGLRTATEPGPIESG